MSFHNSKRVKRRRADNGLTWKEANSKTPLYISASLLVFGLVFTAWLLVTGYCDGSISF